MKRSSYLQNSPRSGLTLIEVIAAVALLSTLLVGSLVAHGELMEGVSRDKRRLEAIQLTDGLITEWVRDGVLIPVGASGEFSDSDKFRWQTVRKPANTELPKRIQLVELQVFHKDNDEPLLSLDLAAPNAEGFIP